MNWRFGTEIGILCQKRVDAASWRADFEFDFGSGIFFRSPVAVDVCFGAASLAVVAIGKQN